MIILTRGEQWSFFGSDGMVIFPFARTNGINGFSMVFGLPNHYHYLIFSPQTIAFDGFPMVLGSFNHWFQWFSMVMDHWSNNAMVLMDCSLPILTVGVDYVSIMMPKNTNIGEYMLVKKAHPTPLIFNKVQKS